MCHIGLSRARVDDVNKVGLKGAGRLQHTRANILGACPVFARPNRARDDVYMSDEPADHADAAEREIVINAKKDNGEN